MRNREAWKPSKFVQTPDGLRGSRDERELARSSRFVVDLHAPLYEDMLRRHARGSLLDLGCGKAPLYGVYAPLVTEITCVDWPGSAHGDSYVDHFLDLNEPLDLPGEAFDTILLSSVLEHIREPDRLWREMARVLRPGGKVLLSTPFIYPIHEAPHDYYRHTSHRLELDARRAGLQVIELVSSGGLPESLLALAAKACAGSAFWSRVHLGVASAVLEIPFVRRSSERTRDEAPLCYFLVAGKAR
jgi:SAM-dependent methyltransferase